MNRLSPLNADAAVYRLGFRPFYLLAAAFAAVAIPAWLAAYLGTWSAAPVDLLWHVHEMIFGFAVAIVAGFLLTAVQNWTGIATPHGRPLQGLVALWLAGRIAALAPPAIFALVDGAFLFVVAGVILHLLLRANNRRNLPVFGVVLLLAVCNTVFHLAHLGYLADFNISPLAPVHGAILLIALLITLIGGRVAPMFTRNGAPGSKPRQLGRLDLACVLALAVAAVCWLAGAPGWLTAATAWLAALLHAVRLALWDPLATWRVPLLWSFHLSYALLVGAIALLGFAALGLVGTSTVFHLLAAGGMTGMIGAMITRTALGHTGRMLRAGGVERIMFVLLPAGALARVAANGLSGTAREHTLLLSGACWSMAFLFYLWRYAPFLTRPRADGRPG